VSLLILSIDISIHAIKQANYRDLSLSCRATRTTKQQYWKEIQATCECRNVEQRYTNERHQRRLQYARGREHRVRLGAATASCSATLFTQLEIDLGFVLGVDLIVAVELGVALLLAIDLDQVGGGTRH